ncbi:MAG: hypothetical protein JRI77_09135 [Deltaproteobacteria bacterium]|nr:hypothetical protein [Deltaproteobacteria bacterium]
MKMLIVFAAFLVGMGIFAGGQAIADKPFELCPSEATSWKDMGIVYGAGAEKAYYPCVLYDRRNFGERHGPKYKMWYSDGSGTVTMVTSRNGRSWSDPTVNEGLERAHHVQVVYDPNCFGATPCDSSAARYRIWYWDMDGQLYSICAMATARSVDGINWTDKTTLTQSEASPLVTGDCVTGGGTGWNRGSYGPIDVIYQPGALNTGDDPWNYSYVMFYDGTNGSNEETGLAYSTDGKHWTAYGGNPVLRKGLLTEAWDNNDAAYGTVLWDGYGFHFWYSGGGPASGGYVHAGIGYAYSLDGLTWTKALNPILHINDEGAYHRDERTYTASVVDDGKGKLKMYYSAKSADGDYAIGLAVLKHRRGRDSDD